VLGRCCGWTGLGLIVVGVERQALRLSLSHIAEGEWRAVFMSNPMFAPAGFGVARTPWQAAQRAAWAALQGRKRLLLAVEHAVHRGVYFDARAAAVRRDLSSPAAVPAFWWLMP
jgi:hypothetical protein